jgi:hypothetical protein
MRPGSASQTKACQECPRIWGADKLGGLKEPERTHDGIDPREAGKHLHAIGEKYLDGGIRPDPADDMGLRFMQGLPHLPPPGSGGVEGDFLAKIGGLSFQMYIDVICPVALVPPPIAAKKETPDALARRQVDYATALDGGWMAVLDHKSTKDAKKKDRSGKRYGLSTKADFLADPQAMLYAAVALIRDPSLGGVYLRWVYYSTQGAPYAEARDCAVTRDEVLSAYNRVVQRWAVPMAQIRAKGKGQNWLDLPANPARCNKYKGGMRKDGTMGNPPCFLSSHCQDVTETDKALALLATPEEQEQHMEDLLEELRKQAKTKPADPINGVVRAQVEPEDDEEDDTSDLLATLSAPAKAAPKAPAKTKAVAKAAPAPAIVEAEVETGPTKAELEAAAVENMRARFAKSAPPPEPKIIDADRVALRDMFAASALETAKAAVGTNPTLLAMAAYQIADAMLKARE